MVAALTVARSFGGPGAMFAGAGQSPVATALGRQLQHFQAPYHGRDAVTVRFESAAFLGALRTSRHPHPGWPRNSAAQAGAE